jgi:uncharacterized RDD family membrane protein YckC
MKRRSQDHSRSATKERAPGGDAMGLLLLLPFVGLLWLPFYNDSLPTLFGFPFFYWYQFLWVPVTALLIWIVYRHGRRNGVE